MLKGKPFVKWAGGKRSVVDKLIKLAPLHFDTYYEPFVGASSNNKAPPPTNGS